MSPNALTRILGRLTGRPAANDSRNGAGRAGVPTLARIAERQRGLPPALVATLRELPDTDAKTLLTGRDILLADFDRAVASWQDGTPTNVALVGPRGSGMSALLLALRERVAAQSVEAPQDEPVVISELLSYRGRLRREPELISFIADALELALPANDFEHLVAQLASGPRRIVFLEDLQDMFLRVVDGTQAMEALLGLVSRTAMRVLWVASCRRQSWRILDHQYSIGRVFATRLRAELPDEGPLETAVRSWNAVSTVPILYRGEPGQRRFESPGQQQRLEKEFLPNLWQLAGGNLIAARLYWLDALEWDEPGNRLLIPPLEAADLSLVRSLPRDQLFSILSILEHGGLSPSEHAEIYMTDAATSQRILESLVQTGLIDPLGDTAQEARYDINPAADARLVSTLEDLNLIY